MPRSAPARFAAQASRGLVAALALAACGDGPRHPSLERAALPPLSAASRFVAIAPEPSGHSLSPDGRRLAWIAPWLGRSALHVRDLERGEVRRYRGLPQGGRWSADGRWLLFTRVEPNESSRVLALDTEGPGDPVELTPARGVKASLHQVSAADPGAVLVLHNRRDARLFDLYRIELATRRETLVAANPGDAVAPVTDAEGRLRGWQRSRAAQRPEKERQRPLRARVAELRGPGKGTFRILESAPDGSFVWALSSRGRERLALVAAHPILGERVVFEDPHVDVSDVDMSRVRRAPLIARALPGAPRFAILDEALRADLGPLLAAQGPSPFSVEIESADAAERRMIVLVRSAEGRRTYLLDRPRRSHTLLAEIVPGAAEGPSAGRAPIVVPASDGVELRGYLTLPSGVEPRRLPLVLHVHGGPWLRTGWGDPASSEDAMYAQFLANRGYAVLQVDFRGSAGYGRGFMYAGAGEFAGRMQQDLHDAVRWAVARGIADPGRVAIMGWSYGGYAALVGLTRTPRAFACAVSLNGPTDLAALVASFPPYWQTDLSLWHDFVGDPAIPEDRADMSARSPLSHAARAERPALLIHGARDARVPVDQAERMVAALRGAGKPVEYLRIETMGHNAGWWVHRLAVLRATEKFLHRCLGGRAGGFDAWEAVAGVWAAVRR